MPAFLATLRHWYVAIAVLTVVYVAISIAVSTLIFRYLERPSISLRHWINRHWSRVPARAPE